MGDRTVGTGQRRLWKRRNRCWGMGIKDYLSHIIELKSGYGCGLRDINAVKKLQFEFEGGGNSDNREV